uniref:Myb-like, SWIRM and MPN domain-containing protein 1 n=1 Tax=Leptobrachium leishanense TaxID=445787 RepID=A0A8C5WKS3_9ANUR
MAEEADVDIEGDVNECTRGGAFENLDSGFDSDRYLESAWRNEDVLQPWTLDGTISEENKAAIEKMLLEEEYYLSNKPLPAKYWSEAKDGEKRCIKRSPQKKTKIFCRNPGNSPGKWTAEEKLLFEQGVAEFGRQWTNISRLIGSRTVLQVKSYARHYFKNKCKLEETKKEGSDSSRRSLKLCHPEDPDQDSLTSDELPAFRRRADPNLNAVKIEKLSDDEEVDITDEMDDVASDRADFSDTSVKSSDKCNHKNETPHGVEQQTPDLPNLPQDIKLEESDQADGELFNPAASLTLDNIVPCKYFEKQESHDSMEQEQSPPDSDYSPNAANSPQMCENEDDGEELKPPEQEMEIDRNFIMEEEKQAIPEFFEGRQTKTPDRYLRIRNYILDQWESCKPRYLNKTSVRPGLKNCGDVNCIGRIHMYLELVGAINFGCEQAVYNRPRPVDKTKCKEGRDTLEAYELAHRLQTMRTRRRRVRDPWGNWRDAKDLEGQTFVHLSAEELARRREEKMKSSKCYRGSRPGKSSFDPFQLIPCSAFNEEKPEPFQVRVAAEVMLVLDLHAHVSMAEVIGLLGGRYSEADGVLEIWAAEPCNSLSTSLQCEMDPVSQTQASEALAERGYSIIGWYHSHPTFDPNPSIRDIDTQAKYQSYFSRGGAKFLGMIISPYNRSNPLPQSQVSCLIIGDDLSTDGSYRIPYRFQVDHLPGEPPWDLVFEKASWIIEKYRFSPSSIPMNRKYRQNCDLTCIQKLLSCMKKTLGNSHFPQVAEEFLSRVEDLFHTSYQNSKVSDVAEEQHETQRTSEESSDTSILESPHFPVC